MIEKNFCKFKAEGRQFFKKNKMVLVRYSNLWAKSLFTINENSKLEIREQYFFFAWQFEKKG